MTTPVKDVLEARSGVCQDFAHFMIACLRSLHLPARYVSGYVRTTQEFVGARLRMPGYRSGARCLAGRISIRPTT